MEHKITEDDFEEIYKPQTNHLDNNASFNGWMYETFGKELDYVCSIAHNPMTAKRVWTILEADGKMFYCPGYSIVNRIGYLICEKEYTDLNLYVKIG